MVFRMLFLVLLAAGLVSADKHIDNANFTYWCMGNCDTDVSPKTEAGYVIMGGGTDVDDAFAEQIRMSGEGDFVVIRTYGTDAYNSYIYDLGDSNSVSTFLLKSKKASYDPFVIRKLQEAEAVFMAGGNQADYVTEWENTPIQDTLRNITARGVPIGGTSAGCAMLGNFIYTALNDTVYSSEALANPYNFRITLGKEFLQLPYLTGVITDPHFVVRDRMGRLVTFMARLVQDGWVDAQHVRGIGIDEHTAVVVDSTGYGRSYGSGTAYFVTATNPPEVCRPQTPLTFEHLVVQRIDASQGDNFDVRGWSGGVKYSLGAENGKFQQAPYGP